MAPAGVLCILLSRHGANEGTFSKLGFSFVGKENEPAMKEHTLLVFD